MSENAVARARQEILASSRELLDEVAMIRDVVFVIAEGEGSPLSGSGAIQRAISQSRAARDVRASPSEKGTIQGASGARSPVKPRTVRDVREADLSPVGRDALKSLRD